MSRSLRLPVNDLKAKDYKVPKASKLSIRHLLAKKQNY